MASTLKENNLKFKGFGLYQIIGGAIGIYSIVVAMMNEVNVTTIEILLVIIAIALYSHSIYCGNLLLQQKKKGLKHTIINQSLQLINFSIFGCYFKYICGLLASFGITFTPLYTWKVNFEPSTFRVNWNADPKLFEVNLNLVAVFVIYSINTLKKKIEETSSETSSIGKEEALPPT